MKSQLHPLRLPLAYWLSLYSLWHSNKREIESLPPLNPYSSQKSYPWIEFRSQPTLIHCNSFAPPMIERMFTHQKTLSHPPLLPLTITWSSSLLFEILSDVILSNYLFLVFYAITPMSLDCSSICCWDICVIQNHHLRHHSSPSSCQRDEAWDLLPCFGCCSHCWDHQLLTISQKQLMPVWKGQQRTWSCLQFTPPWISSILI